MPFLGHMGPLQWVIILVIVLLLFGAPKLPGLARSIGQSLKIFKDEVRTDKKSEKDENDATVNNEGSAGNDTKPSSSTSGGNASNN